MTKRLFERSPVSSPDLTTKLASGKAGEAATNITWQNVVFWLQNTALNFLNPNNNLDDLDDVPTARTNLDVLSSTEIGQELNLKADKTNVLEKDNTTSFTPQGDYEPSTKEYTDKGGAQIPWTTATKVSANLSAGSNMECCKIGPTIHATGICQLDAATAENVILFTLPGSFPVFNKVIYFSSNDGFNGETIELKTSVGTRNVVKGANGQLNTDGYFSVAIPVI